MDFSFVNGRLGTGAAISGPEDAQAVADAGFTHVIDCIAGSDDTAIFAAIPTVTVLYNGVEDDGQPKPPEWFGKSIDFALGALAHPHAKVYAHCAAGINRGPSTCFAVMLALGFAAEDAEAIMRHARPQIGLAYKADAISAVQTLGYA